jgi:hypothetical protein
MKCDTRIKSRREGRNFGPLVAALHVLIALASIVHAAESPRLPNIVILFADDMNFGPLEHLVRWSGGDSVPLSLWERGA